MRNFSQTGYRFTNDNILRFLVEEIKNENSPIIIDELISTADLQRVVFFKEGFENLVG